MAGKKSKALLITLVSLVVIVIVCAVGYYYAQLYVIRKMRSIITDDVKVQIEALLDELVEKEMMAQLPESDKNTKETEKKKEAANKQEVDMAVTTQTYSISDGETEGTEDVSSGEVLSDEEESLYNTARKTVPINDQLRGLELIEKVDINHALELAEPGLNNPEARKNLKEYAYSVYSGAEINEVYELYHKYKYLLDE